MIGFDYDGTLSNANFFKFAREFAKHHECCIITSRDEIDEEIREAGHLLNIKDDMMFAIGKVLNLYDEKAHFIKHKEMMSDGTFKVDIFFDDDPWEILALHKAGIPGFWITPDADSMMGELTEQFVDNHLRSL